MTIIKHSSDEGDIYGFLEKELSVTYQVIPSILAVPEGVSCHATLQHVMAKRYCKPFHPFTLMMKDQSEIVGRM
jgi:hypothetical protein